MAAYPQAYGGPPGAGSPPEVPPPPSYMPTRPPMPGPMHIAHFAALQQEQRMYAAHSLGLQGPHSAGCGPLLGPPPRPSVLCRAAKTMQGFDLSLIKPSPRP